MSADSNGRRAWLWGGAAALLLLLALMQLGSGPDPIVSRAELRRRQIYDAAEWAQRVPIELATSYVVRSKLREYVEELELPDEMRARLLARLDAPDFVDELVPFLIAVKGMYAPAEDEGAPQSFDSHLREVFGPGDAIEFVNASGRQIQRVLHIRREPVPKKAGEILQRVR